MPEDEWFEEWTSDDFMAIPELVNVLYENQQYNPKLQYMTGVARDDASYLLCKLLITRYILKKYKYQNSQMRTRLWPPTMTWVGNSSM